MGHRTILDAAEYTQFELTTPLLEFDIKDEAGVGFQPQTLVFTLIDGFTDSIVNGRNAVNVLSSCNSNGHVSLRLDPNDLAFVTATRRTEVRRALFRWTWSAGTRADAHEIEFPIENHSHLP